MIVTQAAGFLRIDMISEGQKLLCLSHRGLQRQRSGAVDCSKSCLHADAGFPQWTLRELCSWDLERILSSNVTCSIPEYLSKAFD